MQGLPTIMERSEILNNIQNARSYERMLMSLKEQAESLQANRPAAPAKPVPPALQPPIFQPIPYPNIIVPDFGMSPWYRWAIICIVTAIITFILSLIVAPLILTAPYRTNSIGALAGGLSGLLIWLAIVLALKGFFGDDKRFERYIDRIQNSSNYKQQCAQIDAQNAVMYQNAAAHAQATYEQDCIDYDKNVIPDYQVRTREYESVLLPQWEQTRNELLNKALQTKQELDTIYGANIIPYEYRNFDALEFLVPYMESSQSSLQEAIAQYEKKKSDELIHDMIASQEDQAYEMQQIMEDQRRTIEELQDQLDETQRAAQSAKHWSMAGTALSGYAAYKSHKIGKQLEEKDD